MCLKLYWTLVLLSVPLISQEKTKTQICTRNLSGFSFLPSLADGPDVRQNLASSKKGFVKEDQRLSTISTNSCMKYYTGLFPDSCVFYSLRVFLLSISHFPLSSPTQSVDLLRLDIFKLSDAFRVFSINMERMILQSEILPKIREFYTSGSPLHWTPLTTRLLHACAWALLYERNVRIFLSGLFGMVLWFGNILK